MTAKKGVSTMAKEEIITIMVQIFLIFLELYILERDSLRFRHPQT